MALEIEEDVEGVAAAEALEVVVAPQEVVEEASRAEVAQKVDRRSLSSHTDMEACLSQEARRIFSSPGT